MPNDIPHHSDPNPAALAPRPRLKVVHLNNYQAHIWTGPTGAEAAEGARVFTVINYCKTTIWPGITLENSFNGGGFPLKPGESVVFTAPVGWVGRIWRRTGCDFDRNGNGSCQTGTCGSVLKCSASGQTPTTLVEFTLAPLDFYDVSLVDGFNLPLTVTPVNGQGGHCSSAGMKCPRLDM
ncbi:pathogenesis-related thaumatin-like protein 3.5 [Musa acuminata AAA Group]|uniref:pathogenesis-related thaumatin-like protein 3.5 n=1 Tax=Musa acuminata AAA Group TaxID=214697 RepID=UPI0031DA6916